MNIASIFRLILAFVVEKNRELAETQRFKRAHAYTEYKTIVFVCSSLIKFLNDCFYIFLDFNSLINSIIDILFTFVQHSKT